MRHENAVVIGGLGVVGTATRRMLGIEKYYDTVVDSLSVQDLLDMEYVFLCLPTPTVGGACDISLLREYFELLGPEPVYIIRSTVPPGTAMKLGEEFAAQVLSCPEFLTQATAHIECLLPDLLVLGGDSVRLRDEVWSRFFYRVRADHVEFTDTVTAELIKYAVNTFYATKTLFANALYDVAEYLDVDYNIVRDAMYARKWIGQNHLTVPWKGKRGVNGKCLPKDLEAFASFTDHRFFDIMHTLNARWVD